MSDQIFDKKSEIIPTEIELPLEDDERVVTIDRISRTVKGGRRIRFRALVVIGNRGGRVGLASAKANDVQTAIAKAKNRAQKTMIDVPITNGTIAHEVRATFGATTVVLKPASAGHSIIAGGAVRAIVELAGIKNIVSKAIGSPNPINTTTACYLALQGLTNKRVGARR